MQKIFSSNHENDVLGVKKGVECKVLWRMDGTRLILNVVKGPPVMVRIDGKPMMEFPTRILQQNCDLGGYYLDPEFVAQSENF